MFIDIVSFHNITCPNKKGRNNNLRFFSFSFTRKKSLDIYSSQSVFIIHMATATGKTRCVICSKEKATIRCGGCFEEYCFNHMTDHRQQLNTQLDEVEINRDLFRQSLTQQIEQPNNQTLIQQINQWEIKSIAIIQQTAEEARKVILNNFNEYQHRLEIKLNELTNQIRDSRHENDFNEINLRQFQEELDLLTAELTKPMTISIQEDTTSLINKVSVHVSSTSDNFISDGENSKFRI
jgi:hypothetical protein